MKEKSSKIERQHKDDESESSESIVDIRGMDEKLEARNTLIVDLMDVMDSVLNVKAKIEIVKALD